jgi:hypothetical protein
MVDVLDAGGTEMKRALIVLTAALGVGAAYGAETGKAAADRWEATSKSMTGLLSEGYRLVSVLAPNPQVRVFFLSKGASVAKCSEEQVLKNPPPAAPRPGDKGVPGFDPRQFVPEMETKVECSSLAKPRR